MNKLLKTTICSLIALMVLAFGVIVEAGRIPSHMVPLTTYATKKVTCYLPLEKPNGWIDPGDLVIVSKIYSSGWAYGSYPTPRGRVSKFFKIDDLLYNPNFRTLDRMAPKYRVNVYRNYDYKETIGSVSNNEDIWVVSNLGDVWQIVYKVDSGGYKMGWVPYWDCLQKPVQNPMVKPVTRPQTYIYPVDGFYKLTTLFYYNSVKRSMGYKHSVWWNRSNNGHFNALDIACNNGTKVKAVASGTVTSENQGTNHIIVIDHGNMKSLYAHLRKKYVAPGTKVYAGQEIGEASDIGIGGGNYHLHLEFSNMSPWEYYRDKIPFQYCRSTLSAYNNRCESQDKQRFGAAVNWILKNTKGFTTD